MGVQVHPNSLVLELVEGETLAQRIIKGALPVDDALSICRQIADGLEAAHEKGVVHRDLKPANVMLTEGDKVKILDFGLAKALSDETQNVDSSQSPTLTEAMTQPGVILGTAAYMSPEQAKGKTVDKRADIWAFGCILYECLTGKRAFDGETVTETLAAVLTKEPEWEKASAKVQLLLRRCLERDPRKRLRDISEAMAWIENAPESALANRPWLAWSVAALCFLVALSLVLLHFRQKSPPQAEPAIFKIALADEAELDSVSAFALSPDGRHVAFAATGADGMKRVWIRAMDSLVAKPLPGTEFSDYTFIFWSADSRYIAFEAEGKLKKIDVSGGFPEKICDLSKNIMGGSWNRDGMIIFGLSLGNIMQVSASGGSASDLTKIDLVRKELGHGSPAFLPDGRHFLYYRDSSMPENKGIYIGSLRAKPEDQGHRQLIAGNRGLAYVASHTPDPAQLLFLRDQTLVAQTFDDKRLELVGSAKALATQVGAYGDYSRFSASTNGILIYRTGGSLYNQPAWLDRQGKPLGTVGEPGFYLRVSISPKGDRAAVGYSRDTRLVDIWLLDLLQNTRRRFTFGKGHSGRPVWSPDGERIIFASNREGLFNLYQKGSGEEKEDELLLKSSENKYPTSWSSDGRYLLYTSVGNETSDDLWLLPLESGDKPISLLNTEFNEGEGQFSPDMRWIAYSSDESGSDEIYVRAFAPASGGAVPSLGQKYLVSRGGGKGPRWRRDSKELYYRAKDDAVMAVDLVSGSGFQPGIPRILFKAPAAIQTLFSGTPRPVWDVAPDGRRFLVLAPSTTLPSTPFTVVLNWTSLLKK